MRNLLRWQNMAISLVLLAALPVMAGQNQGQENVTTVYPLAILPFEERGRDAKELGAKVTTAAAYLRRRGPAAVEVPQLYLQRCRARTGSAAF